MAAENQLDGRVAVVTGGASGIGRATSILLAEQGADVVVGDYNLLEENRACFQQWRIAQEPCDVRVEAEVERLIQLAVTKHGTLDILVNNAGIGMAKPITEVSEADWDACIDTNLKAAFFGCKHAIRVMRQQNGGSIVNMSSNAGLLPHAYAPVYSISKASLIALTKSLALCHSVDRIRINAVCPGPVGDTRMMDANLDGAPDRQAAVKQLLAASPLAAAYDRMIDPEEVAQAVLYLVSDASKMVTGTSLAIDGGKSLGVPPKERSS